MEPSEWGKNKHFCYGNRRRNVNKTGNKHLGNGDLDEMVGRLLCGVQEDGRIEVMELVQNAKQRSDRDKDRDDFG